jgi:hypothetical protein
MNPALTERSAKAFEGLSNTLVRNITGSSSGGAFSKDMQPFNPTDPSYSAIQDTRAKEEERDEAKKKIVAQISSMLRGLEPPY